MTPGKGRSFHNREELLKGTTKVHPKKVRKITCFYDIYIYM